jgi:hypothetical protein
MLKIIVAGSRNFNDFNLLKSQLDLFLQPYQSSQIQIVSGTAKGADRLGEKYALSSGLSLKKFPAQWDIYGKSAGYRRNEQMAQYATHCLVFWDGKSKGTKNMIALARKLRLKLKIIRF